MELDILKKIEICILLAPKNLRVDNAGIHHSANFQCKSRIILGYTKLTNLINFQILENFTTH